MRSFAKVKAAKSYSSDFSTQEKKGQNSAIGGLRGDSPSAFLLPWERSVSLKINTLVTFLSTLLNNGLFNTYLTNRSFCQMVFHILRGKHTIHVHIITSYTNYLRNDKSISQFLRTFESAALHSRNTTFIFEL